VTRRAWLITGVNSGFGRHVTEQLILSAHWSQLVEEGRTAEKSSFRPSAMVGCARMASRKTV
jgi:hypothetical protein